MLKHLERFEKITGLLEDFTDIGCNFIDIRDDIKSSSKFAIFTRLKISSQTLSPLNL